MSCPYVIPCSSEGTAKKPFADSHLAHGNRRSSAAHSLAEPWTGPCHDLILACIACGNKTPKGRAPPPGLSQRISQVKPFCRPRLQSLGLPCKQSEAKRAALCKSNGGWRAGNDGCRLAWSSPTLSCQTQKRHCGTRERCHKRIQLSAVCLLRNDW